MNRLIKFSANCVQSTIRVYGRPLTVINSRPLTNKSSSNDGIINNNADEAEQIKQIEENEKMYFANVKKSFDNLRKNRENESIDEKRSRLIYQSRKRGILENGLLLGNYSAQFVPKMNEKQLNEYDNIINNLHNEWDLYYWLTDATKTPDDIETTDVFKQMKKYCANELKQPRIVQPDIA